VCWELGPITYKPRSVSLAKEEMKWVERALAALGGGGEGLLEPGNVGRGAKGRDQGCRGRQRISS